MLIPSTSSRRIIPRFSVLSLFIPRVLRFSVALLLSLVGQGYRYALLFQKFLNVLSFFLSSLLYSLLYAVGVRPFFSLFDDKFRETH